MPDAQVIPLPRTPTPAAPAETERGSAAAPPGDRFAAALDFLRRRLTGDYEVDEFGFDAELNDAVLMAPLRPLFSRWFRVDVTGLDNVPAEGPALIVANHSGTIALDSLMTQLAILDSHPAHRHLRMLGAHLVFRMPFVGEIARKSGSTLASTPDVERLLAKGELVGVWPEGYKGIGKPFTDRYRLQRFGRGGFVSAAIRAGVPIVPCSIVGAEEIYPMLGNLPTLARLLGLPYFPITPTFPWLGPLGMLGYLPAKFKIRFLEPIDTVELGGADAVHDKALVQTVAQEIRARIQENLHDMVARRKSVWFG
jgi:1-acyl-sn-glycerol-3-phosphate acyltransferase